MINRRRTAGFFLLKFSVPAASGNSGSQLLKHNDSPVEFAGDERSLVQGAALKHNWITYSLNSIHVARFTLNS